MERDRKEVKDFVHSKLMEYIMERRHNEDTEVQEAVATARKARGAIRHDKMLDKDSAKWLEEFLNNDLKDKWVGYSHYNGNLMLVVDDLSIYADAWAIYCRPGTYSI